MLLGTAPPVRQVNTRSASAANTPAPPAPAISPDPPTVEMIRGDKRARETVRQEH
jgi:hypothetical protein